MKFKKGDVLKTKSSGCKVKVLSSVKDEGKNFYEVEPIEFNSISTFIEESKLSKV